MGILVILFFGIFGILFIAKLASKARPKEEVLLNQQTLEDKIQAKAQDPINDLDVLTSLLIRKEIISREELLLEVSRSKESKGTSD